MGGRPLILDFGGKVAGPRSSNESSTDAAGRLPRAPGSERVMGGGRRTRSVSTTVALRAALSPVATAAVVTDGSFLGSTDGFCSGFGSAASGAFASADAAAKGAVSAAAAGGDSVASGSAPSHPSAIERRAE
jgi:hypothetical protein